MLCCHPPNPQESELRKKKKHDQVISFSLFIHRCHARHSCILPLQSQTTSVMNLSTLGWHTNEIRTSCAIYMHVILSEEIKSLRRIKLRNWHRCIHVYISYISPLNVTAFNFILNTEDTAQLDIPTVSQTDHVIGVAFSFCHSFPTCRGERFTVGGFHGVMNGKKCLCSCQSFGESARTHTKQLPQYYTGTCTNITKIISDFFSVYFSSKPSIR